MLFETTTFVIISYSCHWEQPLADSFFHPLIHSCTRTRRLCPALCCEHPAPQDPAGTETGGRDLKGVSEASPGLGLEPRPA